ncbi:MAG: calcium-transporting P-type ATPase, PMR1-type [Firmicutes bacterium]|nr:calcium-transporting P-type ATPase, PMR1-type [Bacillota bacterium]
MNPSGQWHSLDLIEATTKLGTDLRKGLSSKEATRRLEQYGPNQLAEPTRISPIKMFISQFKDFMVLILLTATIISGLLGEVADAITILAIVVLNATLGFIQEYRAEKSMEALKKLTAPEARVLRDGLEKKIPAADLVPGDLVNLETGDRIAADLRLTKAVNLEIEESTLTGESIPVKKRTDKLPDPESGLGDRRNMAYMGTVVTRGRGQGLVVSTGMHTEMGQIAAIMQTVGEEDTPLQKRLEQLGKILVFLCLGICAVVAVTGIWRGESPMQMFLSGISLAVAAIPEGLPAIVTIALAIGVQKMIRRQAIVRKLPAVETLGCATVICSDKTGTLTKNEMTVRQIFVNGQTIQVTGEGYEPRGEFELKGKPLTKKEREGLDKLLKIAAMCNNAQLKREKLSVKDWITGKKGNREWSISGDPTEGALVVLTAKGGVTQKELEKQEPRLTELPFDSERKRMSVVCQKDNGQRTAYVKGAPDVILDLCDYIELAGRVVRLTNEHKDLVLRHNEDMARQALRVLAFAYRELPPNFEELEVDTVEKNLVFVGLAGMLDPPRPSAIRAVELSQAAGIKTVMITGDHQVTACAIARELGIIRGKEQSVTGKELDRWSDEELAKRVDDIAVYARVSPKHKLRIVRALKQRGHITAMTGDGVNDAPAVKEADIGIAMGRTGTDVTKEASAMVLADDNFATIVAAVEEGRAIYDNIRKFIRYLLACNTGEVLTMFLGTLMGLPLPLLPIQMLWVNLVTDGLPAIALGLENADPDVMRRPPRHPRESVFSHGLGGKIASRGAQIGLVTLLVFLIGLFLLPARGGDQISQARTMAFCTLVFCQLFYVFDCKSEHYSVFELGFFSNPYLVLAVVCSALMQLTVIYVPWLQNVFHTVPLHPLQWTICLVGGGWQTVMAGIYYWVIHPIRLKFVYLRVHHSR